MFKILTLNNISAAGLDRFDAADYSVSDQHSDPDAIILRSFKMHDYDFPSKLKAIGRAGAGVNNIPVDKLSDLGVPVFNAPGANANAVKELVIASLLMSARNLSAAAQYVDALEGEDAELSKLVEAGKKKYAGFELPGKTIAVVGLGAIGRMVANTCIDLGMQVIGFDPGLTVDGAWQLSSGIKRAESVEALLPGADFVSVHVPLVESTRHLINAENVQKMKSSAVLINLARGGIVDDSAVCQALLEERLGGYVTDFPNNALKGVKNVLALPHLGASTREAEENCAIMVVDQVSDYLQTGNIRNSVNFPNVALDRGTEHRVVISNANVPNMLGQISTVMADAGLNIHDMLNQSREDIAYTIVDVDSPIDQAVINTIRQLDGVKLARAIQPK